MKRYILFSIVFFLFGINKTKAQFYCNKAGLSQGWILHWSQEDIEGLTDSCAAANALYLRVDFGWPNVQPDSLTFDWSNIDRVVGSIMCKGLEVVAILDYFPEWANVDTDVKYWYNFVYLAGKRYIDRGVRIFEIWNEPNINYFWPSPDPSDYVNKILKPAYEALKKAAGEAKVDITVITGGLSPAATNGTDYAPIDFLKGIYANGGKDYFDAVGHHPSIWPESPSANVPWNFLLQTPILYDIMVDNGDGHKKIWGTEMGWTTADPAHSGVSEAQQAAYLTEAYQIWNSWPWTGPLFWYNYKDLSDDPQDPFAHLGLVRYDWTPKPALSAFKAMTAACLGGACPCSCPDNITFHTQGQVDEFSSRYPGCNSIKGNVVIRGCEITSLQGLSGLDSVGGNLVIRENAWLYDLSGLENLSFVGGELLISFNGKMTDLTQFKHLKEIGGALTFFGNPSLKSLKGLDSLRSVRGSVNVWVNESLKDLSGLDRLDSIHVNLSIGGNANLIDLNGLGNLRFIGKSFAAGDFFGAKNVSLASLNGLEKLNFIGDKLDIFDNPQLSNLSALDHCIFIGGALRIYNNPVLSTCSVQSICDYLLIPSGLISIGLNASGCETLAKVKSACTTPAPDFNSNVTSGCAPLVVQFVNTSSPCFSSEWQITGGVPATSTETNPLVRFDAPGLYSVTLTIRNAAGSKTVTKPGYIMVLPGPVAGFNGVLINKTVSFSNTSVHATSYSWDFGDGQSSIQTNPKHQFPAAGAYTVTLIAQSDCSADTFSQTFTIGGLPTADFTSDKQLVCAGDTVRFFNFSKNAASFKWAFAGIAGNGTSFLVNPHIVYHTPGIFTVILFAYNDFGMVSEIKEQYITVIGKPLALFDVSGGDGLTLTFDNRSQFGENCQWNFGDGTTGTSCDKEFTHTFPAPGVYTVQLTIQNYCGTSTFTQIISAAMPPVASFTASPEEGCSPLAVQFANKSSANTTSLFWQFPGGVPAVSTAHNPLATFKNPGVYTVSLIVGNAGGSDTFKHIVIVNALPKADFTYQKDGATGTFLNYSLHNTSNLWDFGDGHTGTETDPIHTYAAEGSYTVTLIVSNECGTDTLQKTIAVTGITGTDTPEWLQSLRLYPNPNNGRFSIEMSGATGSVEFVLFSPEGRLLRSKTVTFRDMETLFQQFYWDDLQPGLYMLHVRVEKQAGYVKVGILR